MIFKVSSSQPVADLIKRSSKATCGITEREIVVKSEIVASTKSRLRAAGFFIVGTSEPGRKTRKIWYTRTVGL